MLFDKHHRRDETTLKMRNRELANTRCRYGFNRIFTLLRREDFTDNPSEFSEFTARKAKIFGVKNRSLIVLLIIV
jgi:hypothetical protein